MLADVGHGLLNRPKDELLHAPLQPCWWRRDGHLSAHFPSCLLDDDGDRGTKSALVEDGRPELEGESAGALSRLPERLLDVLQEFVDLGILVAPDVVCCAVKQENDRGHDLHRI